MLPAFARANGLPYSNREGWLSGSFDRIVKKNRYEEEQMQNASASFGGYGTMDAVAADQDTLNEGITTDLNLGLENFHAEIHRDSLGDEARYIDLGVCCPVPESMGNVRQEIGEVVFYGFQEDLSHPENYDAKLEDRFAEILEDFDPDIVHIFGTEFPHTLAMTRVFGDPEHTLIGIQGLCGAIADTYMADLPYYVRRRRTFRDRVRHDSLRQQQRKFSLRARRRSLRSEGPVM